MKILKKTIKISVLNLLAIFLITIAIAIGIVSLALYNNGSCLQDPVGYANEHINKYWDGNVQIMVIPMDPNSVISSGG